MPKVIHLSARHLVLVMLALAVASYVAFRLESGIDPAHWRELVRGRIAGPATEGWWAGISDLGNGVVVAAFILAVVAFRPDPRQFQNLLFGSLATTATSTLLKTCIDRLRPDGADLASWPSGHSAIMLALALLVLTRRRLVLAGTLLVALAVGLARILALRHWPADVCGGFAVAIVTVLWVRRLPLVLPSRIVSPRSLLILTGSAAALQIWNLALRPWDHRLRLPLVTGFVLLALLASLARADPAARTGEVR